jgi:hypothetical protein
VAPNDAHYSYQWGHSNTGQMLSYNTVTGQHDGPAVGTTGFDGNVEAAWSHLGNYGSSDVVIGIIDTGVDMDHPDLMDNLVPGYDFGCNDNNPDDDSASPGHGTACAGVAAARTNNGIGVAGVAGGCKIMPLKVANPTGTMYFSAIQSALYYAADNGVNIVSLSLGNRTISSDPATDLAIQYASNAGVVILAATGNQNASTIEYPASNNYVIAVGAASPCGERKSYASCDGESWWGSSYGVDSKDAAVKYKKKAAKNWTVIYNVMPDLLLKNLSVSTEYEWQVIPICGGTEGTPVDGPDFTTGASRLKSLESENITPEIGLKVYPNPFSNRLVFEFVWPDDANAVIEIFDATGRKIETIFEGPVEKNMNYRADFSPRTTITGMYIYRMIIGEMVFNGKALYLQK